MSRSSWLRPFSHRSLRPIISARRRLRPCLETLEDRITPNSTFTPTTFLDDPSKGLTLREAIDDANADLTKGTDTIDLTKLGAGEFNLTQFNLPNGDALQISSTRHSLIIEGAVASDGTPATVINQSIDALDRVFQIVNPGTNVFFENLTIEGGQAFDDGAGHFDGKTAEGGGILDDGGNVTLSNVTLFKNGAFGQQGLGAEGGGIFVGSGGSLQIDNHSEINNNLAKGGDGSGDASKPNSRGGDAQGGGIYTLSTTTIVNSNVSGNIVNAGNSDSSAGTGGFAEGGGLFAIAPTDIENSTFIDNTLNAGEPLGGTAGSAEGGGIYVHGPTSITDSTLDDNTVNGAFGPHSYGGAALGGGAYFDFVPNTMVIIDSTFDDNVLNGGAGNLDAATRLSGADVGGDAEGGGIYDMSNAMTITGSILSDAVLTGGAGTLNNSSAPLGGDTIGGAAAGGGIFVNNALGAGRTTIDSSIITDNILQGGKGTFVTGSGVSSVGGNASGGGLYVNTASIVASTLSGNSATGGSGIEGGGAATPGVAKGGGAFFDGGGNTLINSTVAGNRVIGGQGIAVNLVAAGGGLFFASTAGGALTNDTVADNEADDAQSGTGATDGGGIANFGGPMALVNTLVAGNSASQASNGPDYFGNVGSSDHNLIGNADGSSGFSTSDKLGSTANPLNPQLGSLTNNGGTLAGAPGSQQVVPTIALQSNSPAINAGDNSAESVTGQFDERGSGFTRVVGGTIDIGAFEVQPPPPPGGPPGSPPPPPSAPALSLFQAILGVFIAEVEKDLGFGSATAEQQTIDFDSQFTVFFGINLAPFIEGIADADAAKARDGGP